MQTLLLYSRGEKKSGKKTTLGHKANKTNIHFATLIFFSKNVTPPFPMYPRGSMMKENDTNIKRFFCSLERKALFLNRRVLLIRIFIKVNEKQNEPKTSREIFPDVNNKLLLL